MRLAAVAALIVVVGCRGGDQPLPTAEDNHKRADEICPKVTSPWFFRIEKDGHVSYLLGTRHIGVSLAKFPQVVRDRIHDAKLAVFELDPADHDRRPLVEHDIHRELGDKLWLRYTALVGPTMATRLEHKSPVTALVAIAVMYEDTSARLEHEIEDELTAAHVPMRGLETHRFQEDLLEKVIDMRMLRATIEFTGSRGDIEAQSRRGLSRYCDGSEKVVELSDEDRDKLHHAGYTDAELDSFEDQMIYQRNDQWLPVLEQLFGDGGAFVAVGAGHVRGERGLAEALRARGWTVTRVAE